MKASNKSNRFQKLVSLIQILCLKVHSSLFLFSKKIVPSSNCSILIIITLIKMGAFCSDQQSLSHEQLRVMTLNYCGVAENPFQFYVNEFQPQLKTIGNIFTEICSGKKDQKGNEIIKGEFTNLAKANFGSIEKKFKKGRYSPLFDPRVGIVFNESGTHSLYRFTTEQEFMDEWDQHFKVYRAEHPFHQLYEKIKQEESWLPQQENISVIKKRIEKAYTWKLLDIQTENNNNFQVPATDKRILKLTKNKTTYEDLYDQQSINNTKKFDYLMFKALKRYVFGKEQQKEKQLLPHKESLSQKEILNRKESVNETNIENTKTDDVEKYLRLISPFFTFSFLKPQAKLSIFNYGFLQFNPDLVFIQQYSAELKNIFQRVKNSKECRYQFINDDDQMIIFKTEVFKEETLQRIQVGNILNKKETEIETAADKTPGKILAAESENFLVMSLHMTSRERVNREQMKYLRELLKELATNKNYKDKMIILGGDLNSYQRHIFEEVKNQQGENRYHFYPNKPEQITTFKKRTALQTQVKKTDKVVKRSQDKIVTNLDIIKGQITMIDGHPLDECTNEEYKKEKAKIDQQFQWIKQKNKIQRDSSLKTDDDDQQLLRKIEQEEGMYSKVKNMLPSDHHPFDQFLLKVILKKNACLHPKRLNEVQKQFLSTVNRP